MEQKHIPILKVTKGNSDRSVRVGDRVYYSPNGDLNLILPESLGGGWIDVEDLNESITDFEYEVDTEYEIMIISGWEIVCRK